MIEDAVEEEHAVVKGGWSGSGALAIPATQYATQLVGGVPADQFPHLGWTQACEVFQWPTTATATITNRSTRATTTTTTTSTTADVSKMMITGNTELADRDADETQDLFGAHHTIELE